MIFLKREHPEQVHAQNMLKITLAKLRAGRFEVTITPYLHHGKFVNQPIAHTELIASYKKVAADAAKKAALVLTLSTKGPAAIKTASETAAKAARRREVLASKLTKLGIPRPE